MHARGASSYDICNSLQIFSPKSYPQHHKDSSPLLVLRLVFFYPSQCGRHNCRPPQSPIHARSTDTAFILCCKVKLVSFTFKYVFVMRRDGSGIAISASSMSQVVVMEVQHVIFSKPHKFRRPQQQLPSQMQNCRLIIHQPKALFTPRTARTLTGIPLIASFL